mmetsp:Transcript_90010/g.278409  ORF Transcript_90010/g.278409 Transcript_90010/m.278409 type:complete len:250 (-) Transcript_90010:868-1617(-)
MGAPRGEGLCQAARLLRGDGGRQSLRGPAPPHRVAERRAAPAGLGERGQPAPPHPTQVRRCDDRAGELSLPGRGAAVGEAGVGVQCRPHHVRFVRPRRGHLQGAVPQCRPLPLALLLHRAGGRRPRGCAEVDQVAQPLGHRAQVEGRLLGRGHKVDARVEVRGGCHRPGPGWGHLLDDFAGPAPPLQFDNDLPVPRGLERVPRDGGASRGGPGAAARRLPRQAGQRPAHRGVADAHAAGGEADRHDDDS